MRILHTSDWHLGRIFHGKHLTEDQAYILDQFIDLVKDSRPDVVVVSGDIYDRSVPPVDAVKLLDDTVSRIVLGCKVPMVIIAGNHDSPDRLGFGTRLMEQQRLYLAGIPDACYEKIILGDDDGPVHFYAVPYLEPSIVREKLGLEETPGHNQAMHEITGRISSVIPVKTRTVMVAHAYVAGSTPSESERPLSIGGAETVDAGHFRLFNYTALGHLHRPQNVHGIDRSVQQKHPLRYPGSLLKYSFSESDHEKSVTLAELDKSGSVHLEEISLKPKYNVRCIEGCLEDIRKLSRDDPAREDYLMITLHDRGAILDIMGKLRECYPNVLHIERPQFNPDNDIKGGIQDHRKMSERELFETFFQEATGDKLTEQELSALTAEIDELQRNNRETAT